MFDPLLEEDPWIQGLRAQDRAEGITEGELKSARSILANIVRKRFPSLATAVEAQAAQIDKPDRLAVLVEQISLASDENAARKVLESQNAC